MTKTEKRKIISSDEINYESLRLDVLKSLADDRNILSNGNKEQIIERLISDDNGKYIRETLFEKKDNGYIIAIDIRNKQHCVEIGRLIEKGEAKSINRYCDDRIWYWSPQKLI